MYAMLFDDAAMMMLNDLCCRVFRLCASFMRMMGNVVGVF